MQFPSILDFSWKIAYNNIKKPTDASKHDFSFNILQRHMRRFVGRGTAFAKSMESALVQLTYHFLLSAESPALGIKRAARDSVMYTFPGPLCFPSWLNSKYWNVDSCHGIESSNQGCIGARCLRHKMHPELAKTSNCTLQLSC